MVWIRIDEDFPDHPKLFLLESRLECFSEDADTPSKADAIEVIFRLFKLAMKVDPVHGELTKYRNQIEKLICGCRVFGPSVATLVEVGFIDQREDGRIYVHDWWEVNGKFVQKLITDRDRKRAAYSEERERRVSGGSDVSPHYKGDGRIHGDSAENPRNGGVNDTVRDGTERNVTETETVSESPTAPVGEKDDSNNTPKKKKKRSVFVPPTLEEVQGYIDEKPLQVLAEGFIDFYEAKGWMIGKGVMKDWKAACRRAEKWDDNVAHFAKQNREGPQYVGAERGPAVVVDKERKALVRHIMRHANHLLRLSELTEQQKRTTAGAATALEVLAEQDIPKGEMEQRFYKIHDNMMDYLLGSIPEEDEIELQVEFPGGGVKWETWVRKKLQERFGINDPVDYEIAKEDIPS